mmetsp:Transcript_42736/g.83612  ORF Transcript_42736/g.83612 Transcript_42736/m.83612 type:complete len:369 (-) Transcript_42736:246-1352(-)
MWAEVYQPRDPTPPPHGPPNQHQKGARSHRRVPRPRARRASEMRLLRPLESHALPRGAHRTFHRSRPRRHTAHRSHRKILETLADLPTRGWPLLPLAHRSRRIFLFRSPQRLDQEVRSRQETRCLPHMVRTQRHQGQTGPGRRRSGSEQQVHDRHARRSRSEAGQHASLHSPVQRPGRAVRTFNDNRGASKSGSNASLLRVSLLRGAPSPAPEFVSNPEPMAKRFIFSSVQNFLQKRKKNKYDMVHGDIVKPKDVWKMVLKRPFAPLLLCSPDLLICRSSFQLKKHPKRWLCKRMLANEHLDGWLNDSMGSCVITSSSGFAFTATTRKVLRAAVEPELVRFINWKHWLLTVPLPHSSPIPCIAPARRG